MRIKNPKIVYFIVIILFVLLSFFIGYHHEPWADEAHAWLIARDTSLFSLFFKYLHTDGHPALWHLILKFIQLFNYPYEYFYIISIIFSTVGVILFEFKSKFPLIIKILFPFSFFIFYQYTVVTRGYCLLLPILSLIAIIWNKRFEKTTLFTFLIILLMSTEAYTFIFAGVLYLSYIYDIVKNKNDFRQKKHIISLIVLFIFFILTILYVYPISSNTFSTRVSAFFISDSFITQFNTNSFIKMILSIAIILYLLYAYRKYSCFKKFIILFWGLLPVFCFYIFFYSNLWHYGILLLLFIFIVWIQNETNNKLIIIFLILTCSIQCFWSFKSSYYDLNNNYSASRDVATFLKKYDLTNAKIYGDDFYESSINPYFSYNIFNNWDSDIGFFYYNNNNKYYTYPNNITDLINLKFDIMIFSDYYVNPELELLNETYVENSKYENQSFSVYISKDFERQNGDLK